MHLPVVDRFGIQSWRLNGKRHRIGGPAAIGIKGSRYYYHNGFIYKIISGHSIQWADSSKQRFESELRLRPFTPTYIYKYNG